jgi:hypothetical protein
VDPRPEQHGDGDAQPVQVEVAVVVHIACKGSGAFERRDSPPALSRPAPPSSPLEG